MEGLAEIGPFCKPNGRFLRLIPLNLLPRWQKMSFLSKLFSRKTEPKQRIRVCIECGMPIADHKDWCSILRGQQEMARKAQAQPAATPDRAG
jgi:hypothetical protein